MSRTPDPAELEHLFERKKRNDQRLKELLEHPPEPEPASDRSTVYPDFDILQSADELLLAINLPGVLPNGVQLELQEHRFRVTGSFPQHSGDGFHFLHQGRPSGPFACEFALPVKTSGPPEMHLEHGILQIRIPLDPSEVTESET